MRERQLKRFYKNNFIYFSETIGRKFFQKIDDTTKLLFTIIYTTFFQQMSLQKCFLSFEKLNGNYVSN